MKVFAISCVGPDRVIKFNNEITFMEWYENLSEKLKEQICCIIGGEEIKTEMGRVVYEDKTGVC